MKCFQMLKTAVNGFAAGGTSVLSIVLTVGWLSAAGMVSAAEGTLQVAEQAYYNNHKAELGDMVNDASKQDQWVIRYRLGTLMLNTQGKEAAKSHMYTLLVDLEAEVKAQPKNAEAWAILSSVYGMMTFLDPAMAMSYGPKAGFAEASAADWGQNNPMVLMLTGINKYHTPEQWGGGKQTAFDVLTKAVAAYESKPTERVWGYVDALAWRSMAARALGKTEVAEQDLAKAKKLQPSYGLVQQAMAGM